MDALSEAIKELDGSLASIQAKPFGHFKKLLCPTLQLQWKDIVVEKCDGDTYVNFKGVVPGVICGHNLATVKACYMRFVKLFGP